MSRGRHGVLGADFDFEIRRRAFEWGELESIVLDLAGKLTFPLVYILTGGTAMRPEAYVGETTHVRQRMQTHLQHAEKGELTEVRFVVSEQFNKSAALHLEAKLIGYLGSEGRVRLHNGNAGLVYHDYYQRERYDELFERLWERLREEELAERSLAEIDNTDLFKFSPYKALSADQYEVVRATLTHLIGDDVERIFVNGAAGTGKSVVAIFLMKLLTTGGGQSALDPEDVEGADDNVRMTQLVQVQAFRAKYPLAKVGLVVAMTSLRNTLKTVFRSIDGLNAGMVLKPSEVAKRPGGFDVLLVDEAHRLRRRRAIGWMGAYDAINRRLDLDKEATELDWIVRCSRRTVFFYDAAQSVKPSDVDSEQFERLRQISADLRLETQHRSRGGVAYTRFVRDLLDDRWATREPFDVRDDFEVLMYDDFGSLADAIKARDAEVGLSRLIAGYAWDWVSKRDPQAYDIELDGRRVRWNMVADDWINSPGAVHEVGCIHTTQGYDLNYAGIVFGPEIKYDTEARRIIIERERYRDRMGKQGVSDDTQLGRYVKQIYYTIMSRGIRGVYVYVCDPALREHFRGFFRQAAAAPGREVPERQAKIIPIGSGRRPSSAVRYYDVAAAAGAFSAPQQVDEEQWLRLPPGRWPADLDQLFACRVVGESMNRIVPSGSLAVFRRDVAGSRDGRLLLLAHASFREREFGAGLTFKRYRSERTTTAEGWRHTRVVLSPDSSEDHYEPIVLDDDTVGELRVIGEFVGVVPGEE